MAEVDATEKIMELEVEKEAILATLEELKKSVETDELSVDDYESSKGDYEVKLKAIEGDLSDLQASVEGAEMEAEVEPIPEEPTIEATEGAEMEAEVEPIPEEPTIEATEGAEMEAEVEPRPEEPTLEATEGAEYSEMAWDDLKTIAKERGMTLGKGVTKESLIEQLLEYDSKIGMEDAEPVPAVEEVAAPEVEIEGPLRTEIDSQIMTHIDVIKGDIPSLNSTQAALKMKKQVSDSSLNVLKKNRDDGLIDATTYNKLKEKYEIESNSTSEKIDEITAEISSRNEIISKFDELYTVHSEHSGELEKLDEEALRMDREWDFMLAARLYLLSNIKEFLSVALEKVKTLEEEELGRGISYPDETFIQKRKMDIQVDKDQIAEMKTKFVNLETLINSLEKAKNIGEVDPEAYSVLRKEYTLEKNRIAEQMGKLKGHLKMMDAEMKGYDRLNESVESCKSYVDLMNDSFSRIWLDKEIKKLDSGIGSKKQEMNSKKKELSKQLLEFESEISGLLKDAKFELSP